MFANLGDVFEGFVIGVDEESGGSKVNAETFDGPNDAASFRTEGGPRAFVVEGGAAEKYDGADIAVRLLLLESGSKAIAAGVTVQAEGATAVGGGISAG